MEDDARTQSVPEGRSAIEECDRLIAGYGSEARKMQILGWLASVAIILSSSLIPVSIVVSTETGGFAFGKLIPSLLAALAAIAAGAAQIVRPYDRWRLFNKQRYLLEAERVGYVHRVGEYASDEREAILIERHRYNEGRDRRMGTGDRAAEHCAGDRRAPAEDANRLSAGSTSRPRKGARPASKPRR